MRPAQLAKMLGVSDRTIRTWMTIGVITFTRIKRVVLFDPVKVQAELEKFETQAQR